MSNCKLGEIFIAIETQKEHDALDSALWDKDANDRFIWSAKNLSRAIGQTDFSVGATTIKDHRNNVCGCEH